VKRAPFGADRLLLGAERPRFWADRFWVDWLLPGADRAGVEGPAELRATEVGRAMDEDVRRGGGRKRAARRRPKRKLYARSVLRPQTAKVRAR